MYTWDRARMCERELRKDLIRQDRLRWSGAGLSQTSIDQPQFTLNQPLLDPFSVLYSSWLPLTWTSPYRLAWSHWPRPTSSTLRFASLPAKSRSPVVSWELINWQCLFLVIVSVSANWSGFMSLCFWLPPFYCCSNLERSLLGKSDWKINILTLHMDTKQLSS